MKLFECQNCGQLLHFENTQCGRCGLRLGYLPESSTLSAMEPVDEERWRPLAAPERLFRLCDNAAHDACNWLIPASASARYCEACRLNRTIPDLGEPWRLDAWQRLEAAKHRLVYSLMRLGLPLASKAEDAAGGLAFDFLAPPENGAGEPVLTGHADGLVTLNIVEADDAERERIRKEMGEPYRTLVGHFRHEIGHYYWDRLVRDSAHLERYRSLFGDERTDYGESLKRHYREGPPTDWPQRFVSGYAASHPWEDWAETWAHYLHIMDTTETGQAYGIRLQPSAGRETGLAVEADLDPYLEGDFDQILERWLPIVVAVNSLNRSMGQPDLYPFVLPQPVIDKLRFIHTVVHPAAVPTED